MEKAVLFLTSFIPSVLTSVYAYSNYVTSFFDREHDPDATRSVPEMIESRGFRSEKYNITTTDGYILTIFRIVNPFMKRNNATVYPVLLAHGAMSHAGRWLMNSDDGHLAPLNQQQDQANGGDKKNDKRAKCKITNNLGFLLANEGYDVWLLNWRGSKYSRSHKRFSPKDAKFWDFSNDELIQYDLPACINFVIQKTGHPSIGYVGLSFGSNAMFGLLSSQPDFNEKIKPFIALAPSVKLSRYNEITIPFIKTSIAVPKFIVTPFLRFADILIQYSSPAELPFLGLISRAIAYIGSGNMFQYHLSRVMQMIMSQFYAHSDIDSSRLTVYAAQTHLSMSRKTAAHFLQQMIYDEFSRFDYGEAQNKKMYADLDPPMYDLREITNRTIALIYSKSDGWVSQSDVDFVTSNLKSPVLSEYRIKEPNFSHTDYMFSSKLGYLVNPEILKILKKAQSIPDSEVVMQV